MKILGTNGPPNPKVTTSSETGNKSSREAQTNIHNATHSKGATGIGETFKFIYNLSFYALNRGRFKPCIEETNNEIKRAFGLSAHHD